MAKFICEFCGGELSDDGQCRNASPKATTGGTVEWPAQKDDDLILWLSKPCPHYGGRCSCEDGKPICQ